LINFGLIPEFIGRLPVYAVLNKLKEEDLIHILTDVKNSLIRQYEELFKMDGIKLSFEEGALRALAKNAIDKGTGARGLRAILECVMVNIMYDAPSRKDVEECIITSGVINSGEEPKFLLKSAKEKKSKPAS
jgi:ATP-dependent Clp protease ATP-binding subunit ClpX